MPRIALHTVDMAPRRTATARARRLAGRIVYWLAVFVVSVVLVVLLLLFLESRDQSSVDTAAAPATGSRTFESRAKTTIRFAALYRGWHAVRITRS